QRVRGGARGSGARRARGAARARRRIPGGRRPRGPYGEAMRLRRKILCVRRSKLCRVASPRKVRTSSQPVSAMDQNSLNLERTVFLHGGRTGCARKSGEGGGGLCGAFASSRRLERIRSLSRIRRPPPCFVRPPSGVFPPG